MALARDGQSGLALGAWGAVQATAAGVAIALGGILRDCVSALAAQGALGAALDRPGDRLRCRLPARDRAAVRDPGRDRPARAPASAAPPAAPVRFGLAEFPG